MTPPRYQAITRDGLRLLTSHDGGALIRLVAGDATGSLDPASPTPRSPTPTPPGARRRALRSLGPDFSAFACALTGRGTAGDEHRPIEADQLVVFGAGDRLVVAAAAGHTDPFEVLLLGGLPIRAPIVHYGPFVMNTRDEVRRAIEDYQAGRLGTVPADELGARRFA